MKIRLFQIATTVMCLVLLVNGVSGYSSNSSNGQDNQPIWDWDDPLASKGYAAADSIYPKAARTLSQAENVSLVGHLGGSALGIAVHGSYAYLGNGPRLIVFDISDPAAPVETGRTSVLPSVLYDIVVMEFGGATYAYSASGYEGVGILDVSDPQNPTLITMFDTPGFPRSVSAYRTQTNAYVLSADFNAGLRVIDVTDPAHPQEVGFETSMQYAFDVAVLDASALPGVQAAGAGGMFAYVTDMLRGLYMIDITDPAHPVAAGFYSKPGNTPGVKARVVGSHAYAYLSKGYDGLLILDVTSPDQPVLVGTADTNWSAGDLGISGDSAYIASGNGVHTFDISNPAQPQWRGAFTSKDWHSMGRVAAADGHVFATDSSYGMHVLDVANPVKPVHLAKFDESLFVVDVQVNNGQAFLAIESEGAASVDYGNPQYPSLTSRGFLGANVFSIDAVDDWVYAGIPDPWLQLWGLGTEGLFESKYFNRVAGFVSTPGDAADVVVKDSLAYMADGNHGITIVNVADPANPQVWGNAETPGIATDIAVSNTVSVIADDQQGLRIFDVSNPRAPTEIASYKTPGFAKDVDIFGTNLYVADRTEGLRILDIENPETPMEVGFYDTIGYAYCVTVVATDQGQRAFVCDGREGLRVLDVDDPAHPASVGYFNTAGYAYKVVLADDLIFIADQEGGFYILQMGAPEPTPSPIIIQLWLPVVWY